MARDMARNLDQDIAQDGMAGQRHMAVQDQIPQAPADDELHNAAAIGPPSPWTVIALVVMSVITLIFSGYMIYTYSSTRPAATSTASNPPAQKGFTPMVDETRPASGTTGQGGERR